jgi:hypothetical protein
MLPLIAGAIGIGSALFGAHKSSKANNKAARGYEQMAQDANRRMGVWDNNAQQSRAAYQSAVQGFDPSAYASRAAGSMYNDLASQLAGANAQRMANLNRRGLFASDLGGNRQQAGFQNELASRLAGLSMQQASMEQQRQGMLGQLMGSDLGQSNALYQAATGLQGSALGQRQAAGNAWGSAFGQIGGSLLGGAIGGAFGGGPAASMSVPSYAPNPLLPFSPAPSSPFAVPSWMR